jgi:hypothetical protein
MHVTLGEEPYSREASNKNRELVEGKIVKLEKDVSETDKYGRLLRYVWVNGLFVNAELIRLGYAQIATYPPDVKYQELFLKLQAEAREAKRGLWAGTQVVPVSPSTAPSPPQPPPLQAPPSVAPLAALSLQIVSVTSPVRPGAHATLVAKTAPGAECAITVYYKSGPSTAQGLYAKTADSSGNVSWTWMVGTRTTPGSWRIVVIASLGGQTAAQTIYFTVQ